MKQNPTAAPEPIAAEHAPGYIRLSSVRNYGEWGLVEIALAIVAVLVVVIIILVLFSPGSPVCQQSRDSQACLDERFAACMATEKYTRQECIILVGRR